MWSTGKMKKIPIIKIYYDSKKEKVTLKVGPGKTVVKKVPTDEGYNEILDKIWDYFDENKIDNQKIYFRIFNSSRSDNLLKFGSDRADQKNPRKFDLIEWELYPFRLVMDYFYTDKKGNLLTGKNGPLLSRSLLKTHEEFRDAGVYRGYVYDLLPDEDVYDYYAKILKKYKRFEKDKKSKYHNLYVQLKQVEKNFPKGEKAAQPEFFLTEKLAMKKRRLMREDVTFAYKGTGTGAFGLDYILRDVMKKRISDKVAGLVIYKNLKPVHLRKTKGGLDLTALYTFDKNKLDNVVALFLLIPK